MTLRERIDALVKHAAPIHPGTGTDQSVHGKPVVSMSGKPGTIYDDNPAKPISSMGQDTSYYQDAADALFEAKLETNGSKYSAVTDDIRTYDGGRTLIFEGKIFNADDERIAGFSATIKPQEGIIRDISFFMEGAYQDEGIGTMFIAHWMEEATAAGFHRFEVGTTEIGQYAWAMAGFDWDDESETHHMSLLEAVVRSKDDENFDIYEYFQNKDFGDYYLLSDDAAYTAQELNRIGEDYDAPGWWKDSHLLVERWKEGEHIMPLEIALLGVADKKQDGTHSMHFGKAFMLNADTWHGFLELGEVKKSLDAHYIWRRWARTDSRAIEQDDPRWLAAVGATVIRKHAGPGAHPSGSPQTVHAGGTTLAIPEPWRDSYMAQWTELVPVTDLKKWIEMDRMLNDRDRTLALAEEIKVNGFYSPVFLEVRQTAEGGMESKDADILLVEGNHRVAVAEYLGISHVPVTILATDYRPWSDTEYGFKTVDRTKELEWPYNQSMSPVRIRLKITMQEAWEGDGYKKPSEVLDIDDIRKKYIAKHGGPGPHSGTGTPQKVHGKQVTSYGSHPETGTIFDDRPAQDRGRFIELLDVKEIFEAKLELNGETYLARVTETEPMQLRATTTQLDDTLQVRGTIERVQEGYPLNEEIGSFVRYLYPNRVVYNDSFNIAPDHRGSGIGTMFLSHWEDELAAAGFRTMDVTAVNIGRYAWAVAGYDFSSDFERERAVTDLTFEVEEQIENDQRPAWFDDADAVLNMEKPTPLDFAMIGHDKGAWSGDMHYGKYFMLNGASWSGTKRIGLEKSLDAARAVWKRWAENDPRAVEQDDPAFLSELAVACLYISKHGGPGPHPGTMTEQTVHGRGAGVEDDEMNLSDIDEQVAILTREPHRARNVAEWASSHIRSAREHLSGLYRSESYSNVMESRIGSWVQRLNTLYYRARNIEEEVSANPAIALVKHGGPGPHAGTGTPQAIHAGEKRSAVLGESDFFGGPTWQTRLVKLPYSIVRNVKMKGVHTTHSGNLVKVLKEGLNPLKSAGGILGTGIYSSFGEFSGKVVQEEVLSGPELEVDINLKKAIYIDAEDWGMNFTSERATRVILDALEDEGVQLSRTDREQMYPDNLYQKIVDAGFDGIIYSRGSDPDPDWEWGSQVVAMTPGSVKVTRLRTLGGHSVGNWARDKHELMTVSVPGMAEALAEEGLLDYEPPKRRYGDVKLPVINKADTLPAIVWTWADFERWLKTDAIVKHYGPGPHPGTGTDQAVHGGGGGPSSTLTDEGVSDEGLFDDELYREAPDPEAEQREQYPEVFKLIDRGKEVRPGLDAKMAEAEVKALSMNEQEEGIEKQRVLAGEWSNVAASNRRRLEDKLTRYMKQHYPDADDNRLRVAWMEAEGDFEKFKSLMAGSYDTDITFETKVTPAMANKLTSEYWGEAGYGFDMSREAGVTFDGKSFTIPNTAAGDALLSDVDNRGYLAYSNSERAMWDRLGAKLREAGYDRRRSTTEYEFHDPEVWVKMTPGTEVIMSGRNLGDYWTTGPGKSTAYDKETKAWVNVTVEGKGIYLPANTGARIYAQPGDEGNPDFVLDHANFDVQVEPTATSTLSGSPLVTKPPTDEEGWQRMPLSRVTESMARESRFWTEAREGFSERTTALYDESKVLRGKKAAVYREAFTDWLGEYRSTGGHINVMRKTPKIESFLKVNQVYPTEWLETSNNTGRLSVTHSSSRGHYTEVGYRGAGGLQYGEGRIKTDGSVNTNVHEMGHRLEHTYKPLYEAEQEFYRMRTSGRSVSNMQKEDPGAGYRSYEITVPDDFADPYMGKEYSAGYELISMAMPRLVQQFEQRADLGGGLPYRNKEKPYNLDEQMLHWVLGVLVDV